MSRTKRIIALFLSVLMLLSSVSVSAFAADGSTFSLTIASTKTSALAPGVQEQEIVAYDANGDRIVYYTISADIATNSDVQVKANYHDNDNTGNWGKATVVEQANAATAKRGYNVVASTNAAYYNVSTGQPTGAFVMEGVNINGDSTGNTYPFFAIMKDGTAMIGQKGTFSTYSADIQEAVAGHYMLVWDGAIVATDKVSKYPRSTVGVKANGDVVLMVADGNQKPYSAGLTLYEQAEVMKEMGCIAAVELDGGGSATYAAKMEGTDEIVVRNSCCDGTVRSVSNTLMVISTAVADGTFDHANLSTEYPFYAPGSEIAINAFGADKGGYPAEIPASVTWALSDASFGSVTGGVFTSNGKLGTVTVQMLNGGAVVGSLDVTLVHPTEISFAAEEKIIPYGSPSDFTVTALYNGADMYASPEAYNFDCTAGSMNGFIYTAPADGVANATVTVAYKYDSSVASDSIAVSFGKGSDIIFDFEGGAEDAKYWGDYYDLKEAVEKGEYTNGYSINHELEGATTGNLIEKGMHENVFLATRENGQVHSGDYSLAYTMDYRNSQYVGNWLYAYLYYWGDSVTLLDTEKGIAGTRLGMWMYIPEEAVGSCARFAYTYKAADGSLVTSYMYLTYMYVEKGFSKLTSDKIPEAGWAYVYVDMKQLDDDYVSTSYYKDENGNLTGVARTNYAPAFIQFIVSSSAKGAEKVTFYIDDITLDYSDAVDDRDMPIISNPLILEDQASFAIDGRTLDYDTITVTADAAEDTSHGSNYTGLDADTAQVYVDGQPVDTKFSAGKISATGVKLPNGTHDITFEIADKQGNYTKLTRQIKINAVSDAPAVTLTGVPVGVRSNGLLYTGGQYNIELKTDKVEGVDSVNFKLWLNSASEWSLENMSVLSGFEVDYDLDENACTADITVTRKDSNATGAATLLTIPVYAWSWNAELGYQDASTQWNKTGCAPQVTVSYKVKYGEVNYTEDYDVDVAGFSNIRVDAGTELNSSIANLKKTIGEWHYHTAVAVEDVANTCTTDGHTGRTVCSTCNSILNWGTTRATGHNYELTDGVLACACGEKFNGEKDGITYIDGVAYVNGWYKDTYYYANGKMVTGPYAIDSKVYVFDENGVYQPDAMYTGFVDSAAGKMYFLSNTEFVKGFVYISNVAYYFDENGIARNGEYEINGETCLFEDGVFKSCSTADVYSAGWAGMDVYYIHYKDGRFLFTGEGEMFYHQSNASIPWAKDRENIKSIFVAKGITDICRYAFSHTYNVKELTFEEGSVLEKVGYSAFHFVEKVEEVVLPETVKTLEWHAFSYCSGMKKIYMPDGVESIHSAAFDKHAADLVMQVAEGSYAHEYAVQKGIATEVRELKTFIKQRGTCGDGLTWKLYSDGVLNIDGEGSMPDYHYSKNHSNATPWASNREMITKIVIGAGVENVGDYAFYGCTALSDVEFAADAAVTTIGTGAFGYTESLDSIVLPASLEVIEVNAFCYSGLETVDFEDDSVLTTIGSTAFRDNTNLVSLYLPDSVSSIGSSSFHACESVVLSVADGSPAHKFAVAKGYEVIVRDPKPYVKHSGECGEDLTWKLYSTGELYIDGEGTMPDYDYGKYSATAAPWALYREEITKVVIGAGVENIGSFAFYQCALTDVEFAADAALTTIGTGAFGYLASLTEITLPASLEVIDTCAFYYSGLETVDFEDGSVLTTIGSTAFRDNTNLVSVYLPDSVSSIGSSSFHACEFVVLSVADGSPAHKFAVAKGLEVFVRDPKPYVKHSGECGEDLTWELYSTGELYIDGEGTMPDYDYGKYSATAAPWALYREEITKVVIGAGVENIGSFAFYQCALTDVEFAAEAVLTTIGTGAFGYLASLTEITLPASIEVIDKCAFYYSGLETVDFEDGSVLTTIGSGAFRDNLALVSVYIPDSVSTIGSAAFHACESVVLDVADASPAYNYAVKNGLEVSVRDPKPHVKHSGECGENLTWKLYSTGELYIDGEGTMPDYDYGKYSATAAPWALYREEITKVVIGAGVENIGSFAFYQCALTDVEFAAEAVLTTIGTGAFGYNASLTDIVLPASIEVIDKCAFYYSGLETVDFEDGSVLTIIGVGAFQNNTDLLSIYIPDGVSTIGSAAFHACDSVVASVAEDSYAHRYMAAKGYEYEIR